MSLRKILKGIHVSKEGLNRLDEEEMDLDALKLISSNNMNRELNDIKMPKENINRIKEWRKIMNIPNRMTRSKSRNSKQTSNRKSRNSKQANAQASNRVTRSKSRNSLLPPSPPPVLKRQNTVSEELLTELVNNIKLRTTMDRLMESEMKHFHYLEEGVRDQTVTLYDHKQNGFKSDLKKDKQSIYYRWNKENNKEAFHLSLNHTENEKHSNRTGIHRDKNGSLHIRLNDGHGNNGRGIGKGTLCRMLINFVKDTYEITVCLPSTRIYYMDPVAKRVSEILVAYYQETGRQARISEDSGKGKGKGKGKNDVCKS